MGYARLVASMAIVLQERSVFAVIVLVMADFMARVERSAVPPLRAETAEPQRLTSIARIART
jgi:hypothetical protein